MIDSIPQKERPSAGVADFLQMILGDARPSLDLTNLPRELVEDLAALPADAS